MSVDLLAGPDGWADPHQLGGGLQQQRGVEQFGIFQVGGEPEHGTRLHAAAATDLEAQRHGHAGAREVFRAETRLPVRDQPRGQDFLSVPGRHHPVFTSELLTLALNRLSDVPPWIPRRAVTMSEFANALSLDSSRRRTAARTDDAQARSSLPSALSAPHAPGDPRWPASKPGEFDRGGGWGELPPP